MGATVTNEGLGVTTTTSDHTAATQGPTDVCWNPPMTVTIPHPNYVTTDKAVEHTSGKTLFQGGNVVRVGEAIMPSDPAHGDIGGGGGVVSHTYRLEARLTSGSPNVRAEGLPPGRTTDPTTQNHANTTGQMYQVVPPGLLVDNPEEWLKRCSYDTSKIKCNHHELTEKPQIDVLRGDTITVEAHRKNAKEPGAAPACANPPHMKWLVTRSGGTNAFGISLADKSEEFTGDTLTLSEEWTAPLADVSVDASTEEGMTDAAKHHYIDQKNNLAQANADARGSSVVENQDGRAAYQQVKQNIEEDKKNQIDSKTAEQIHAAIKDVATLFLLWRAVQNPLRVNIVGHACSGSVTYEVRAYPEGPFSFEMPLDPLIEAGRWVQKTFKIVKDFGRLADVELDGKFNIPGDDLSIKLDFSWKEGEDYEIEREAELALEGEILSFSVELKVPIINIIAAFFPGGEVAAKAINWVIEHLGAEACAGISLEIKIKAAAFVTFSWCESKGWKFSGGVKIPIEFKLFLFIRVRAGDSAKVEGQVVLANADPALVLEGSSEGLKLFSDKFTIKAGLAGVIYVDCWFFTYDESGEWYPDWAQFTVEKMPICTVIGN